MSIQSKFKRAGRNLKEALRTMKAHGWGMTIVAMRDAGISTRTIRALDNNGLVEWDHLTGYAYTVAYEARGLIEAWMIDEAQRTAEEMVSDDMEWLSEFSPPAFAQQPAALRKAYSRPALTPIDYITLKMHLRRDPVLAPSPLPEWMHRYRYDTKRGAA